MLFGLTHAHGPAEIAYAVVEGVSFGLRDGLDTLRLPDDVPLREMALVGGGARSAWWGQLLADILQVPLTLYEGSETGGALGAARLAWLADAAPWRKSAHCRSRAGASIRRQRMRPGMGHAMRASRPFTERCASISDQGGPGAARPWPR